MTRGGTAGIDRHRPPPPDAALAVDAEARWRSVFDHAMDGILLTAPDGRVFAANPAACVMLGRTEDEICRAGRAGLVVPDEAAQRFLEERARVGHARALVRLRRGNGATFLAEVSSSIFATSGGEQRTSMVFRDATESERARRALVILADAGRVLARTLDERETLASLTGLIVPELADVCVVDLKSEAGVLRVAVAHRDPSKIPEFIQVRRRALRPDTTAGVDYVLRTGESSCVLEMTDAWLATATMDIEHFKQARALGIRSFVAVPLITHGCTIGALTVMSDGGVPTFGDADVALVRALGERAASAIDNARRHADAVEARRLRDEVLGVVAHDLRGPLNTIHLATQLLGEPVARGPVEIIDRAVRRADVLIQDLLLAVKAEGGTLPLVPRAQDLAAILAEVDALHRTLAESKSLGLIVRLEGDLSPVTVDRHRIVQMLSNLMANAIKFTAPGGRVELLARRDGDRMVLTVHDTGAGIAADELPHVFDRYWQGKHSPNVGAGLGLSISRAVARAHGGDLTVESAVGVGTTFTAVLPLCAQPPAPDPARAGDEDPRGATRGS